MVQQIYSIKDVKVGSFFSIFACLSDVQAMRNLHGVLMDTNSNICKYPQDFELWCLGTFNDQTGLVDDSLRHVCTAVNVNNLLTEV